ncbi:MAG: DUF3095 family protein [Rhodobacterales bacterium]|nr:DUF3095 family protein [Rhodobacterales bacterium]
MTTRFFEEIPGFSTFNDLVLEAHYQEVPEDWWVLVTDVVGSTGAIEAGRYKDVNTIGAATLVALRNAIPDVQVPFVFGGDGASAAFPGEFKAQVIRELSALRALSTERFGLELRVGMVAVRELRERGIPVLVAKYLLERRYPMALFRGGALSLADQLIKTAGASYEVPTVAGAATDLLALSCRWKEIEASRGCALAILAMEPTGDGVLIGQLLSGIDAILDPGTDQANPVRVSNMAYRSLGDMWTHDERFGQSFTARLRRRIDTLAAYVLFNLKLGRLLPFLNHYVDATPAHTDFRKFDDMLRMVIDCTPEQTDRIEALCKALRVHDGLIYGLHRNRASLMTCYVPGFGDGEHVHFIDGSDGGYAMAAKQLKAQLKSEPSTWDSPTAAASTDIDRTDFCDAPYDGRPTDMTGAPPIAHGRDHLPNEP